VRLSRLCPKVRLKRGQGAAAGADSFATAAHLLRAGSELPLSAKPGDIFCGRFLPADGGRPPSFVHGRNRNRHFPQTRMWCSTRANETACRKIRRSETASGCFLPPLPRSDHRQPAKCGHRDRPDLAGGAQTADVPAKPGNAARRAARAVDGNACALDQAIRANPGDQVSRLARVAALEAAGLLSDAAAEMRIAPPDGRMRRGPRAGCSLWIWARAGRHWWPPRFGEGQTFALLIGISSFKDPEIPKLQFAHLDAMDFAGAAAEPARGGAFPDNVRYW